MQHAWENERTEREKKNNSLELKRCNQIQNNIIIKIGHVSAVAVEIRCVRQIRQNGSATTTNKMQRKK